MPDDEHKTIAEARLGRVLKGKYRLDRVLGIGGMATVYAATHRNKKRVAIKMLHPELSIRENIRTRFLREGYVANSVDHPGAVSVHDDDVAEDGSAFLVMDLLEGSSVEEVAAAKPGKKLPIALVLSIGDALLEVLIAAHAKGIVHRDLKPANLFLTNDGRLEVLDFGIARLHDETSSESTAAGSTMGTPAFMAPEQAQGMSDEIGGQTDVWAVAATLFVLLSGTLVHEGRNAQQLILAAATMKARSLASVAPEVPRAVVDVIDKALAFEKSERWTSAKEMRDAVRRACLEATGAPVEALPKMDHVTGLEDTIAPGASGSSGSGDAFDPTVDASTGSGAAVAGAESTAQAVSNSQSVRASVSRRAVPRRALAAAVLACAVAVGSVKAYRTAVAPHARYCLDVVDTNDGPRCVFEVGAEILQKRLHAVSRVTERGGHVVLVEHVNFAGVVDQDETDFARAEIVRDASGAVREVIKYDPFGVNLEWQKWSDGGKHIDLVDIDGKTPRGAAHEDTRYWRKLPATSVTGSLRTFDKEGRVRSERFFGPTGRPRPRTADGVFGFELEFGTTPGVATKRTNLGADGAPAPDASGIVFTRRDDNGLLLGDTSFFDAKDGPAMTRGAHILRTTHDAYEERGLTYLGLHGEPVTDLDQSFHELRIMWDRATRTGQWSLFDVQGHPQSRRDQWFWTIRRTFDERGRQVLEETLDGQGNRALCVAGNAAHRSSYDDQDHEVVREELDASGALAPTNDGVVRRVFQTDAHDNHIEVRYYDQSGRLAPPAQGGSIVRSTYDDRGLRLTTSVFDAGDHLVANAHGFASVRNRYDRLRNLVEVAYFDPDAKSTSSDEGFAIKRWTYDENDDLVAEAYFDATGAPTLYEASYAIRRLKYDDRGLVVEESFHDVHGDPALVKNGYASVERVRDRNGDVVEESYFGKKGEPILREGGFASRKTSYDVMRRPTEVALFDIAGKPVRGAAGWAVERTTYDERGLVVRVDHLDGSKTPAPDRDARASVAKLYDSRGNLREETSLDAAGKPVLSTEGFATKKSAYDDHDEVVAEALVDADGRPVSGKAGWTFHRLRYDDFGKMTEESFFDGAHEPIAPKELAYASMKQRFDDGPALTE